MKNADIKELTTKEIQERIGEEKLTYTKLKFNHAVSGIENPMKLRNVRISVARLKTELRKRELEPAPEQQAEKETK